MANRDFDKVECLGRLNSLATVTWEPNGTSDVTQSTLNTQGKLVASSVERTGQGTFKISLRDPYAELVACHGTFLLASNAGRMFKVTSEDVNSGSDPHVVVQLVDTTDGAATDQTAVVGDKIGVTLQFSDASIR